MNLNTSDTPTATVQAPALKVQFKLFLEDDLAQAVYYRETAGAGHGALIRRCFMLLLAGVLLAWAAGPMWYLPVAVVVILLIAYLAYDDVAGYRRRLERILACGANLHLGVPMQVLINAQGIGASTGLAREFYCWARIHRIVQTGDHLFFYLGIAHAVIVPRRAFEDDQAFDAFYEQASLFKDAAPGLPPEDELTTLAPLPLEP